MSTKSEWKNANRELLDEARLKAGEPPTAEEMFAYSRGQLSEAEAESVRERLTAYPELAAMYGEPFPDEPQPGQPGYVSDADVAAGWAAMESRIGDRVVEPKPVEDEPRGRVLWFRFIPTAFAATVALVFGGLFANEARYARMLEMQLRQPLAVAEPVVLQPASGQRGTAPPPKTIDSDVTVETDAYHLVLVMLPVNVAYQTFRVEATHRPAGAPEFGLNVRPESDNTIELIIPRRLMRKGEYQLTLYGFAGSMKDQLQTYQFAIRH